MTDKISVIDLGALSKPANTLIKKVSDAVGGLFAPVQTVRMAKAEAAARLIGAQSEIDVSEIQRRAMHRLVEEESKRQTNMEAIACAAVPLLIDESSPERVDDDWLTNFFDKARIVSNEEMQQLWSAVLAGEANAPGAFSRQTVNLLGSMDKGDAQLFSALCGFMWGIGQMTPLVIDPQDEIYTKQGINFETLLHLQSLGLVELNTVTGFSRTGMITPIAAMHFGRWLNLVPASGDNHLKIGLALFTRSGKELARVCGAVAVPGFFEYTVQKWKEAGVGVSRNEAAEAVYGRVDT